MSVFCNYHFSIYFDTSFFSHNCYKLVLPNIEGVISSQWPRTLLWFVRSIVIMLELVDELLSLGNSIDLSFDDNGFQGILLFNRSLSILMLWPQILLKDDFVIVISASFDNCIAISLSLKPLSLSSSALDSRPCWLLC